MQYTCRGRAARLAQLVSADQTRRRGNYGWPCLHVEAQTSSSVVLQDECSLAWLMLHSDLLCFRDSEHHHSCSGTVPLTRRMQNSVTQLFLRSMFATTTAEAERRERRESHVNAGATSGSGSLVPAAPPPETGDREGNALHH